MKMKSSILLTIITIVYLFFEIGFNAHLIDVTSSLASEEDFTSVEFYGRLLSSFGLALIVFKLGYQRRPVAFSLIALAVMPTFFFAQKAAVDAIAYAQDDQDKVNAALLMNLRAGMISGQIQLEDITFTQPESLTGYQRSFLVALGPLTYSNEKLTHYLEQNYEHLIGEVAASEAKRQRAEFYNSIYVPLNKRIAELYDGYQQYSDKFSEMDQEINEKLDQIWLQYMSSVKSAADNTRILRQNVDNNMSTLVKLYQSSAIKIANARAKSKTAEAKFDMAKGWMITATRRAFNSADIRLSIPERNPDIFDFTRDNACQRQATNGKQAVIRIRAQKPNGRISDVKAPIYGSENVICTIKSYPQNVKKWAYEDFGIIAEHNYGVKNLSQDTVGEIIGSRSGWNIMQKVLLAAHLPRWDAETRNWRGDRATFNKLTKTSLAEKSPLMDDMYKKLGIRVKPGLSFEDFVRSESVQSRIRQEIGDNEFVSKIVGNKPILMNQSVDYFKTDALKEHIIKLSNDYLNNIRTSVASGEFDSGSAIKSIWIPFIAMVLSLFMFTLNAAMMLINGSMKVFSNPSNKIKLATTTMVMLLIVIAPTVVAPSPFDKTKAYTFLLNKIYESNAVMAYVIDWSMRAQPLLYPVGKPLSGIFQQLP